jgi:hypothetical protein
MTNWELFPEWQGIKRREFDQVRPIAMMWVQNYLVRRWHQTPARAVTQSNQHNVTDVCSEFKFFC